ncbi:hypothetical protein G7Y89_g9872 [Cudoniella acicularis]|uniref:2EXR domain-containing protein n=1 Tax=Cudoniella acicularis TaxID=354080 RepID=A0A8H4RHI8_9HELO|nr:hypothetical protein G7Y89_g9872 [Cudoniella acicularis]
MSVVQLRDLLLDLQLQQTGSSSKRVEPQDPDRPLVDGRLAALKEPRTVEIEFNEDRGFFSGTRLPVALKVCTDSRQSVLSSYPCCFGNIIYPPQVVFNFSLDTLLIYDHMQFQLLYLFLSLTTKELTHLQYLAVEKYADESDVCASVNPYTAIKKLTPKLSALKAVLVVTDLADWGLISHPTGNSPMELFEEWPDALMSQHNCLNTMFVDEMAGNYDCSYYALPDVDGSEFADICAPKVLSIWGWRPTES